MSVRLVFCSAVSIALLVASVPLAHAADPSDADRARAADMKKEADALMHANKFAEALGLYTKAYDLSADPAILYNQGRAREALGDYGEALERLEAFKRIAPPDVRAKVPDLDGLIAGIAARVATLTITCSVQGSRVTVRDKLITDACSKALKLRAGTANVEVNAEGFEPFRQSVDLVAGTTTTLDAKLVERRAQGVVVVRATPAGSLVFVDGNPLGPAPATARVTPGRHDIVVRHEGYVERTIELTVEGGERRDVDVPLKTPPPVTSKWWFWTGIGAAVAGGVVLGFALTTEKSAPNGSFSPGQVRGP